MSERSKKIMELHRDLKEANRRYRVMKIKLRQVVVVKSGCKKDNFTPFFLPEMNMKISYYLNQCRSTKKELRNIAKELRDYMQFDKVA